MATAKNVLEDVALVAAKWQNLSNLYSLDIYESKWHSKKLYQASKLVMSSNFIQYCCMYIEVTIIRVDKLGGLV